jgi:hypothetical protein
MDKYLLDDNGRFLVRDYQRLRPFSSFLPGIAGKMGIPLWVFYVNRGQAIASFGVENKDEPILEFQPANQAYRQTPYVGFRTFIKNMRANAFYEPFINASLSQQMLIGENELGLQEISPEEDLKTEVVYFLMPEESIGGLVRILTVTNLTNKPIVLEIMDGLPSIIPYGVTNQILKEIGRTAEAWMEVYNLDRNLPFYRLRASIVDSTEVRSFDAGHFMLSSEDGPAGPRTLPLIVDPVLVFGQNSSLSAPDNFRQRDLSELLSRKQITGGRTPCGFAATRVELLPGGSTRVNSIFGHADRLDDIQCYSERLSSSNFLDEKRSKANVLVRSLVDTAACQTGSPLFDAYSRQNYLDNILRGGYPLVFGQTEKAKVFHVFSRKHGDPERDYNAFSLAPEYYSQGNGNYRDVNQNRREDVWFNPAVGDYNIRTFMSLIQLDGYNPLVIQGSSFSIPPDVLDRLVELSDQPDVIRRCLSDSFTLGTLIKCVKDGSVHLRGKMDDFIWRVLENSQQHINAAPGEGYWVDHWTYNLDLIDGYLSIFPDRLQELLFSGQGLPFYDNPFFVQPRSRKYVFVDGEPRQFGSLVHDHRKESMLASRTVEPCWARTDHGKGDIFRTSLFVKLFCLALIKFSTLDPYGMGIEMEASRPGWDDAMNGLPGLFGSSMAETYALKRLVRLLRTFLQSADMVVVKLPVEMIRLLRRVSKALDRYQTDRLSRRDHRYWEVVSSAREAYRSSVRMGLDGAEEALPAKELGEILDAFEKKIDIGIARALQLNESLPPTYFTYSVDEFRTKKDGHGRPQMDDQGRAYIRALRFTPRPMPLFLEGMVRAMNNANTGEAGDLYRQVKESPLYDRSLKMYKLNASLAEQPKDIGRARAFTPGWLENESIWLHMEYKYLLEVLRAGLYEEFFQDMRSALIPFLDPQIYGRSPLENSSFLVSSAHPDASLHGAGFVARLSGATAEFLSIWTHMMAGPQPFILEAGQICLALKPILPDWLFDKHNTVSFKFLGQIMVTYHNPNRLATYVSGTTIQSCVLHMSDGQSAQIEGGIIPSPYALQVRDRQVDRIDVYFA